MGIPFDHADNERRIRSDILKGYTVKKELLRPRERVQLALAHQETDRVPVSMIGAAINPPVRKELEQVLQRERGISIDDYLRNIVDTCYVAPDYCGPTLPIGGDYWGVRRLPVKSGLEVYEEISHYPLSTIRDASELANYPWPSTDWFDYDSLPAQIAALRSEGEYCLWTSPANPFEAAWYMRGFELFFMNSLDAPDIAHEILQRVTKFYLAHVRRILEAAGGEIDLYFTADDIAGQHGLLMAIPLWQEFIQPCHIAINQVIHDFGVRVIYHSDGAVMDGVPGLLEMGIDVLEALQFDAEGMDAQRLKALYGERLSFAGGISVQSTLPFGTPEDVRAEVHERVRVLGTNGGYLLGPSHAIQGGTPAENVLALFDTAME